MFGFFALLSYPSFFFFFFNDTATTEIYTLSLHDALPVGAPGVGPGVLVSGAARLAHDLDPPALRGAGSVAEALEGDADLDDVAVRRQPSLRLPDEVRGLVGAPAGDAPGRG